MPSAGSFLCGMEDTSIPAPRTSQTALATIDKVTLDAYVIDGDPHMEVGVTLLPEEGTTFFVPPVIATGVGTTILAVALHLKGLFPVTVDAEATEFDERVTRIQNLDPKPLAGRRVTFDYLPTEAGVNEVFSETLRLV